MIFKSFLTNFSDFVCGQRVIRPKDLPDLFCDCISLGWKAIEKEVFNTCKRNKQNINKNYGERVSDYLDFSKLKQSTQIRACLENQSRKNYKEILDKYSTPLSIP